uniref:Variant surface glycoprotein 1714 n=1 Tax=Trypanosoma brucei TaxID=5691 RepID=M4T0T7_9TRYP|nr:variant surface glycoprotein 1714 [Trypanosoma brucei]
MLMSILAAVMLYETRLALGTSYAMKDTMWKKPCQLSGELRKVPQAAYAAVGRSKDSSAAAEITGLQLLLAAANTNSKDERRDWTALGRAVLRYAREQLAHAFAKAKTAVEATASTQELVGAIQAVTELLDKGSHDSNFCLGDTSGNTKLASGLTGTDCDGKPKYLDDSDPEIATTIIGPTAYANLEPLTGNNGMGASGSVCPLLDTGVAGTNHLETTNSPTFMYGIFKVTGTNQIDIADATNLGSKGTRTTEPLLKTAYFDAKKIQAERKASGLTDPKDILKEAVRSGHLQTELESALALEAGEDKGKDTQRQLDK